MSSPVPASRRAPTGRRAVKLRTKLIASIVGLIVVLSAVIGVVTEIFLSNYLVQQVDNHLQSNFKPRGADRFIETDGGSGDAGSNDVPAPPIINPTSQARFSNIDPYRCSTTTSGQFSGPDSALFAIVHDGKFVIGAYRNGPGTANCHTLKAADASEFVGMTAGNRIVTVTVGDYGSFRVVAEAPDAQGNVQITGASLTEVTQTQQRLAVIMALVAGGAILLGGLTVFLIVRRSVRPLERVAETARKVATLPLHKGDVDLAIRVPAKDTDARTEIGSVGAAINQMLGHVSSALTARQASETRVRQFVADASHELRTPLAAIRGYAELARRGEHQPGAVAHALTRVESESARMTTLVDDLLLLARLDSGRPLASEEVDLTVLAVDRVSDARVAGTDHRWQLDLPDEPVTVTGDGARLHQVLANLLANARTHTPPGTTVVTGVRRENGGAVLTVIEDGPGIPEELQPEIFGRFVRGDSSRSRAAGSTGLGLAIVAAVISAHGGTVTVESRPGRTCARVWLPDHTERPSTPIDPLPASSAVPR
jgi:two-component system OmpR family sensor kinase